MAEMNRVTSEASAFPYRHRFLDLPGARLHYIDEGSGPPLLIPMPAPTSIILFRRLIDRLKPHFRVLAFEYPGLAESEAGAGFGHTLEDYRAVTVDFCERLDLDDITLLVNDTAGCVGLRAASDLPQRFSHLVVVSTVGFPLTGQFALVRFVLEHIVGSAPARALNRWLNIFPFIVPRLSAIRNPPPRADRSYHLGQFPPPARDRVTGFLKEIGRDRVFMESVGEGIRASLSDKPALLLFGQADPMRIFGAPARFKSLFREVDYKVIPGENHFPQIAEGERVADQIIAWRTS